MEGEVIAAFGRHYRVAVGDVLYQCFTRGKRSNLACGDQVRISVQSSDQAVIEEILPRRNLVFRSDQYREKLIAANVDQIMVVLGTVPTFSEDLLSRALIGAEAADIPVIVVLNKNELPETPAARQRLAPYAALGYRCIETSFKTQTQNALETLVPLMAKKMNVVLGQSGMGKSTLVNLLLPNAHTQTREISEKLDSGKHTTTHVQIHTGVWQRQKFRIVDSPGFQEFGLAHLSPQELENAFVEFRSHLGGCKFYNCQHLNEPGCSLHMALDCGAISASRYKLYRQLHSELKMNFCEYK